MSEIVLDNKKLKSSGGGDLRLLEGKQTVKNLFSYSPIHLFTFKKAIPRIIRDLAGVTFGSTRRAGFAFAHTAPYRKFGFTLADVFSPHCANCRKPAFTLAEVLITLGIIGVVVALTLPSVIQKQQERAQIVKLKKVYSILNTAFNTAIAENGDINTWSSEVTYRGNTIVQDNAINNIIKQYLSYIKYCEKGNVSGCSHPGVVSKYNKSIRNVFNDSAPTIFLADGVMIKIKVVIGDYESLWCKYPVTNLSSAYNRYMYKCGRIYVDLNGFKGPNKDGYDLFGFTLYQNTITPMGMKNDHSIENFSMCRGVSSYSGEGRELGYCTAWALQNENLDYLHCPNKLSWDGDKSCK